MSIVVQAHRSYVLLSLAFGIAYALAVPPFCVLDEVNHFYRAYQVSEGRLTAERQDHKVGGLLPADLALATSGPREEAWLEYLLGLRHATWIWMWNFPHNAQVRRFIQFPNTALYSAIPYLPQALGIALGRWLALSPFMMLYLGRITNLAASTAITYAAIRRAPLLKHFIMAVGLLPPVLVQSASLSADGLTNSLSFLYISECLYLAFSDAQKRVGAKEGLRLTVLAALLVLTKYVTICLVPLFLLIPAAKARTKVRYYVLFAATTLAASVAFAISAIIALHSYAPYRREGVIDPIGQLRFVMSHPIHTGKVFLLHYLSQDHDYLIKFAGQMSLWNLPRFISACAILMLAGIAICNLEYLRTKVTGGQRAGALALAVLGIAVISLALYVSWSPLGGETLEGIQARYFVPIAPLPALACYGLVTVNRKIAAPVVFCFMTALLAVTLLWMKLS